MIGTIIDGPLILIYRFGSFWGRLHLIKIHDEHAHNWRMYLMGVHVHMCAIIITLIHSSEGR